MTAPTGLADQFALLLQEVRELKEQRVSYVTGQVTAVDIAGSTVSVRVAGQVDDAVQDLTGIPSPRQFLPSEGDTATLAVVGASPMYQPSGIAADAVTLRELEPAIVDTLENAAGAAETAAAAQTTAAAARQTAMDAEAAALVATQAANSITAAQITAGAVTAGKIAASAVTAGTIAASAVTAGTIAAGAVTAGKIAADAIDGRTITGTVVRTAASGPRAQMDTTGGRQGGGRFTVSPGGTGGPGAFEAGSDTDGPYALLTSPTEAGRTANTEVFLRPDAIELWTDTGTALLNGRPIRPRWTDALVTDIGYNAQVLNTAWTTLPGSGPIALGFLDVGAQLKVEWSAPLVDLPAGTGVQIRIVVNGAVVAGGYWSNSGAASIAGPGFLAGTFDGTGAAVSFQVQAQRAGSGAPSVRAIGIAPVEIRYKIA